MTDDDFHNLAEAAIVPSNVTKMVRLDTLEKDAQARANTNQEAINDYARAMREGQAFPPVVVFHDTADAHWLADGFHRVEAARIAGWQEIEAEIKPGTRRDAILYACGANAAHGVRRTNTDKRRAVTLMLQDDEWQHWGNREIARRCGVDEGLVCKIAKALSADNPHMRPDERRARRGDQTYLHRNAPKPRSGEVERESPEAETIRPASDRQGGFEALKAAWQRATREERVRFVAWAHDDNSSVLEEASISVSPTKH